jgi:hypothetical protein
MRALVGVAMRENEFRPRKAAKVKKGKHTPTPVTIITVFSLVTPQKHFHLSLTVLFTRIIHLHRLF